MARVLLLKSKLKSPKVVYFSIQTTKLMLNSCMHEPLKYRQFLNQKNYLFIQGKLGVKLVCNKSILAK
jgi:hypothetical protein